MAPVIASAPEDLMGRQAPLWHINHATNTRGKDQRARTTSCPAFWRMCPPHCNWSCGLLDGLRMWRTRSTCDIIRFESKICGKRFDRVTCLVPIYRYSWAWHWLRARYFPGVVVFPIPYIRWYRLLQPLPLNSVRFLGRCRCWQFWVLQRRLGIMCITDLLLDLCHFLPIFDLIVLEL